MFKIRFSTPNEKTKYQKVRDAPSARGLVIRASFILFSTEFTSASAPSVRVEPPTLPPSFPILASSPDRLPQPPSAVNVVSHQHHGAEDKCQTPPPPRAGYFTTTH